MAKSVKKKAIEPIPTTTTPYVVGRRKVAATTPAVTYTDTKANFGAFMALISQDDVKTHFPTALAYRNFRNESGYAMPTTRGLLDTNNVIVEYDNAWVGIEGLLNHLWEKYLGDKFGSQMLANFVFKLLLQGAEQGWEAIKKFVRGQLGDEAVSNTESIVEALNQLAKEDGLDDIKNKIAEIREKFNKPVESGKKPNIFQWLLRGLAILLSPFVKTK